MPNLRYLLLQTRNINDPMRAQEVRCFARRLECDESAIDVLDLLRIAPSASILNRVDMVLLGGSGHYSVASEPDRLHPRADWLERALESMRLLHSLGKVTFASCWGFQAMARALGGKCVNDVPNAEVGTIELQLTDAGRRDPLFGQLPSTFSAQAGHEDHVIELPARAELLASSERVREQAFCFPGKPIYCTQFHPELDVLAMVERIRAYPEYIERIAGVSFDDFVAGMHETPEANMLLKRFVEMVFE